MIDAGALLFNTTATVYTADPVTRRYTVVARSDLPCRLASNPVGSGASQPERAELLASRRLLWPPDYVMPPFAEVEVEGLRWRVQGGSPPLLVKELPTYRAAMVVQRVP